MRLFLQLLMILFVTVITACETPSDSFERVNTNDPASPVFAGGTVNGLTADVDSSGVITLRWPSANNSVDKHIIEKSLGDSTSFTPLAVLEPNKTGFVDESGNVQIDTYYRLSSFIEVENEDVLYGNTTTKLEFGSISNMEFDFQEASNELKLTWRTGSPFYTHFIISSNYELSDEQRRTVKIPADGNKHSFLDPLVDIDYDIRSYTIKGVIEDDGIIDEGAEEQVEFNVASFFKPSNVEISIINEQDWEITWESNAFFATELELIRPTSFQDDVVVNMPANERRYIDSAILDNTNSSSINTFRRYRVKFLTESGESNEVVVDDAIQIDRPVIAITNIPSNDSNSITIYGSGFGEDRDLIKEYIIEKPHPYIPERFIEIARAGSGKSFQFTDTDVSEAENPVYRVRTITSIPSKTMTYAYSHDYSLDYEFDTGLFQVTSLEISSDKRYLAATTFWEDRGNSVVIHDLENQQSIGEISIPNQEITDVKISRDDQTIYMAVPTDRAIYQADFPGGENVQKLIDDAFVNTTPVLNITLSPDNSIILGTGGRGFVKRWDLVTLNPEFIFSRFNTPTIYPYKNVAISPDGQSILANNGKALQLDASDGSILNTLPSVDDYVLDHQYSFDGRYMAFVSGFRYPHIFNTETLNRTVLFNKGHRADFHPTKNELVIASNTSVYTYDVETSTILDVISGSDGTRPYHETRDKLRFIDDDRVATVSDRSRIQVWKKSSTQRRWKQLIFNY